MRLIIAIALMMFATHCLYSQVDCAQAIEIPTDGTTSNITAHGNEIWLKFTSSEVNIYLAGIFNPNDLFSINQISLFKGECESLNLIISTNFESDSVFEQYFDLETEEQYFLLIEKSNSEQIHFDITLKGLRFPDCPAFVACQIHSNGSFEPQKIDNQLLNEIQGIATFSPLYDNPLPVEPVNNPLPLSKVCFWYNFRPGNYIQSNTPQIKGEEIILGSGIWNYYLSLFSWNYNNGTITSAESAKTVAVLNPGVTYKISFKYRTNVLLTNNNGVRIYTQNFPLAAANLIYTSTIPSTYLGGWTQENFVYTPIAPTNRLVFQGFHVNANNFLQYIEIDDIEINCISPNASNRVVFNNPTATDIISHFNMGNAITSNVEININGDLTIDQNLSFNNCPNIFMGYDTRVIVDDSKSFIIANNSYVRSNCGCMWYGIISNGPNAFIKIENSIVEDAQFVTNSYYGSTIDLKNSVFNKNYCIMNLHNYNASNPYPGIINGNNFNASNLLQFQPYVQVRPQTAINLMKVNNIHITNNSFSGWFNGIFSSISNITVTGNQFTNINNNLPTACLTSNPTLLECPTAIFTFAHPIFSPGFECKLIAGGSPATANTFTNCETGIHAYAVSGNIRHNYFSNIARTAIYLLEPKSPVYLHSNIIHNAKSGIISQNYNPEISYIHTQNNEFTNNEMAIYFVNIKSTRNYFSSIESNKIYYTIAPTTTTYGIRANNCEYLMVYFNTIKNNLSAPTNHITALPFRGIDISMSRYARIYNNFVYKTGLGIRVTGQCNYSKFQCNVFDQCYYGIYFDTHAQITHQGYSGKATDNQWIGNYNLPTGQGHRKINGNITDHNLILGQEWWYRNTGLTYYPSVNSVHQFKKEIVEISTSNSNNCIEPPVYPEDPVPDASMRDEYWLDVVTDSINYTLYPDENRYFAFKSVFEEFYSDSTWLVMNVPSDSIYQAFYDSLMNTNLPMFADVNRAIAEGDYQEASELNENIEPDFNIIEQNQHTINEIFLRTVAEDYFIYTIEEYEQLLNIATQLPYLGGDAVYTSRVMLGIDPDDYGVSYRIGKESEKTGKQEMLKVYPNPVSGELTIELRNVNATEKMTIQLYDFLGKTVFAKEINFESGIGKLNLQSLRKGIYLLKATGHNGKSNSITIRVTE